MRDTWQLDKVLYIFKCECSLYNNPGSSNGRTPDSESGNWGSNPCPGTTQRKLHSNFPRGTAVRCHAVFCVSHEITASAVIFRGQMIKLLYEFLLRLRTSEYCWQFLCWIFNRHMLEISSHMYKITWNKSMEGGSTFRS